MRKPVDQADEAQWIRQAQAGDRKAFAALVERYWSRIHRWLHGLTGNAHSAEDLTQDAFLKAWSALPSFTGTGFKAWLYRIASNNLIDSRRGPRGQMPDALPDALATRDPGPVATVLGQESQTLVQEACSRLPAKLKEAFLLRTQEDMSFEEIGQVLGVTEETIRWRVFKARHLLLNELKHYLDGKSP
jgi:RNA polymerase sigma-70 factor (ECF subfamily)